MDKSSAPMLVLFDGVCGFCNGAVRFVLARDRGGRFRFAPLQGEAARRVASRHDLALDDLDTMYLVVDYGGPHEQVLARSTAAFAILAELGPGWRLVSLLGYLPAAITDLGYRLVARLRYRFFGRYDECPLPPPEWRARFIEDRDAG